MLRTGVILPVYNVEKTIDSVLSDFTPELLANIDEILIIDNCSNDRTRSLIFDQLKTNPLLCPKVSLILNDENYGYGSSIKAGFTHFSRRPVDRIAVLHSDLQVRPSWLLSRFFEALQRNPEVDFVLASRFMSGSDISHYSWKRIAGNHFFNWMTSICTGLKMSDAGAAMIIVRRELIARLPFTDLSNSWYFHPQLNILLYDDKNVRFCEIPLHWEDSESDSSLQLFHYGLTLLKMLCRFGLYRRLLQWEPRAIFQPDPLPQRRYTLLEKPHSAPSTDDHHASIEMSAE